MTQPTNSIDSELEEILSREDSIELVEYELLPEVKAQGFTPNVYPKLTPKALQAIKAKYVSRKELEEAIELLQQPVYSEEKEGVDGYMVYAHELRAKLLPPTKGETNE